LSEVLLETKGLGRAFGGVVALEDVDLAIETGEITAIIGPNGAGKTTLFNLITGVYAPTQGGIRFNGKYIARTFHKGKQRRLEWGAISAGLAGYVVLGPLIGLNLGIWLRDRWLRLSPHLRVRRGIARTFQNVLLFGNMTAIENIMTGLHPRSNYGFVEAALRLPKGRKQEEEISLKATKYLNMVGLGQYAEVNALSLPLGQQKLLAIARALATEPRLLLLDEPGAGLNRLEKRELSDLIRRIRDMGTTIILVEHDMPLVMGLAEKVVVLDTGKKIAEGTAAQVQKDKKVIAAYLGDDDEDEL